MDMEAFCALCDGSVPPSSFVDHVSECKQKKRKEARQKGADGVRAVCDLCGKSLCNQSALKTHKFQVHTKYSPFKCDLCDYRAKTRTIIKMHRTLHFRDRKRGIHAETDVQCEICGKYLSTSTSLKIHVQSVHERKTMPATCKICNEVFPTRALRYAHTNTVHNAEKFTCHICGKVCTQHSTLRVHLKYHEEAALECKVCGKKLKTDKSLRFHMMSHTGERPSQCSLCDYSCTSDTVLHNHVKFRHKDDFERRKKMNVPRHGNRRTLPAEEREYLVMRNNGGNNEIDLGQPQVQAQGAS